MGSTDTSVVSTGRRPAATRLPTVISRRPTRPDTGARTSVQARLSRAVCSAALAPRRLALGLVVGIGALIELALRQGVSDIWRPRSTSAFVKTTLRLRRATCAFRRSTSAA